MRRVMYIPLDERPCNYNYPDMILQISDIEMIKPPKEIMGYKKQPADIEKLTQWMFDNVEHVDYLVISLDMFVYGGLIPSRLHFKNVDELLKRLHLLKDLKRKNKNLKIFAYNLIMRVPSYNSSDEEPDYYAFFGEKIWQLGVLKDKIQLKIARPEEIKRHDELTNEIPEMFLNDYLQRRSINSRINMHTLDLVEGGIIDFLVFPMDDCSQYGFSAKERRDILSAVRRKRLLHKVLIYPGADEVGSVLVARAFNEIKNYTPRVFVRYSSSLGPTVIPKVEDRAIHETVKYQIVSCGGIVVDNSSQSDFVLMVNPPTPNILNIDQGLSTLFGIVEVNDPFRNIFEFVLAIKYYVENGISCAVADTCLGSQADEDLMILLKTYELLDKVTSYAGWNTSSNTLGTVISHVSVASYLKNRGVWTKETEEKSKRFLFLRYLEDWGYQNHVRPYVITQVASKLFSSYFDIRGREKEITSIIRDELYKFKTEYLDVFDYEFEVTSPWNRLYEIGIEFK